MPTAKIPDSRFDAPRVERSLGAVRCTDLASVEKSPAKLAGVIDSASSTTRRTNRRPSRAIEECNVPPNERWGYATAAKLAAKGGG